MSDYSTIGKTVMDYKETETNIACLEKQLSDIGKALVDLGTAWRESPSQVTIQEAILIPRTGFTVAIHPEPVSIPLTVLDVNNLRDIALALAEATKERDRLLAQLQRMGLQGLEYRWDNV